MTNVFVSSFQEKIWRDKYQYKNEAFTGYCNRIASTVFSGDKKQKDRLFEYLKEFKILFGGRTNSNIGTDEKGVTLFNCFINPMVSNPDSLEGILKLAQDYAITLKTEGGVGFCANFLRPANTLIRKIGVTTPGAIKFLELFDKLSEIITSGNVNGSTSYQGAPTKKSIRKGATMVTMSICHPDIEEFITAKATPNRLTKMNMSVLVTDAFIYAIKNDLDWDLWFPDITFDKYDVEWDGDFEKWGNKDYPFVIYKTIKAAYLWDLLLKNTFNRSEPGILFIDNARRMDNLHYLKDCTMHATNPCAEIFGNTGKVVYNSKEYLLGDVCIAAESRVLTEKGYFPIEELINTDLSLATFDKNNNINYQHPIKLWSNGIKKVFELCLNDRRAITLTDNHKVLTEDGWKEVKDLTRLDKVKISGYVKDTDSVKKNRDLCEEYSMLGWLIGDGWFTENKKNVFGFCFGCEEDNYAEEVITKYIRKKHNVGYIQIQKNGVKCLHVDSKKTRDYFINSYGIEPNKSITKRVPKAVFSATKTQKASFISGLFSADGTAKTNRRNVSLSSNSLELLKDVQLLLSELGMYSWVGWYKVKNRNNQGILNVNGRSLKRFYKLIGFVFRKDKDQLLKQKLENRYNSNGRFVSLIKNPNFVGIKAINYIGKKEVFDISFHNNHNFISEGICVHNCNLGSVNITKFYDVKTKKFKTDELLDTIDILIRSLDNIIDVSNYPLPIHENAAKLKRKIGVGMLGVGSLMMMMNLRYGGDECIVFFDGLLNKIMNKMYQTSALMAKELGPFALYDKKLLDGGYIKNSGVLSIETVDMIKKYGLRHSALCAIAPNGTLGIVAGNVSGGLEPVFANEFTRWNRVEGERIDFKYPNVHKGEWFETDYFKEQKIAGEPILISKDKKYRIDKNSGLCKQVIIKDYGYNIAKENGFKETLGAMDLSVEEHLNVLSTFASKIDQSSSKTINLPSDISFEDFKKLYGEIHSLGIKGCTTYREGSSIGVLEVDRKEKNKTIRKQQKEFLEVFKDQSDKDVVVQSVRLPEQYPSSGYILRSEGKKWYIHIAFKDKACTRPFAIFVNTNNREDNVVAFNALERLEELAVKEGLNDDIIEIVKRKYAYQKNPVKICRMLGFLLRHNVRVYKIVRSLDNVEEAAAGTFVFRIKKFLAQFIKHIEDPIICPNCKEESLIFTEGCYICKQCGHSKCG